MSVSRLKTIAIAALLLINVSFLAVIVIDAADGVRERRETIENVCAVLQAGGIMISPDDVNTVGALRAMRTARGDDAEATIARAILGSTVMTDHGVIQLYENPERGTAEFASAGDFEIRLNEGVITNAGGVIRTVQGLLVEMRIETTSELAISGDQGSEIVTAIGAYRGASIFNCKIEFVWSGESLETIRGRHVTGIESVYDGVEITSVSTALLGFLAAVRDEGRKDVNSTWIYSVEAGYQHRVIGSFGEGVITPAWLITTDYGQFIIDDATGEIQPFA